jgi:hypothetical protein
MKGYHYQQSKAVCCDYPSGFVPYSRIDEHATAHMVPGAAHGNGSWWCYIASGHSCLDFEVLVGWTDYSDDQLQSDRLLCER